MVPGCDVEVAIDDEKSVSVGYPSVRAALESAIASDASGRQDVKIIEVDSPGLTIAFLVAWSPHFKEWGFVQRLSDFSDYIGMCVEGIRIDRATPGYQGLRLVALVNAQGQTAPTTNVARSSLEDTPELRAALTEIYRAYSTHVQQEMNALVEDRGLSLTWAVQEGSYLMTPLRSRREGGEPLNDDALEECLDQVTTLLLERDGIREAISYAGLSKEPTFWTLESEFFEHAEELIREVPGRASVTAIARATFGDELVLPPEPVLVTTRGLRVFSGREPDTVRIDSNQRRADVRWVMRSEPSQWRTIASWSSLRGRRRRLVESVVKVATDSVDISAPTGTVGLDFRAGLYLFSETPIGSFIMHFIETQDVNGDDYEAVSTVVIGGLTLTTRHHSDRAYYRPQPVITSFGMSEANLRQALRKWISDLDRPGADGTPPGAFEALDSKVVGDFFGAMSETQGALFDPKAWRRDYYSYDFGL